MKFKLWLSLNYTFGLGLNIEVFDEDDMDQIEGIVGPVYFFVGKHFGGNVSVFGKKVFGA